MNSHPDANLEAVPEGEAVAGGIASAPSIRPIGSREFASTLITNVVIQACTVVQGILVARLLGPVGRGQFAAAILWPGLFAAMGGMGVSVAVARRAGRAHDLARVIRTGLLLTPLTGTVTAVLCAAAIPWLLPGNDTVVQNAAYVFVPFIIFNQISLAMIAIDQGAGWFAQMNWTRLIVNPVYLLFVVVLWFTGVRNVGWFVIGLLIANAAVAFARVSLAVQRAPLPGPMEPVHAVFREAFPYGLAGLLGALAQSADKALLLYLLGTTQLGFYAVALANVSVHCLDVAACRAWCRDHHSDHVTAIIWGGVPVRDLASYSPDSRRCIGGTGDDSGGIDAGTRTRFHWTGSESGRPAGDDCGWLVTCAGVWHSWCGLRYDRVAGHRVSGDDVRRPLAFSSRVVKHVATAGP